MKLTYENDSGDVYSVEARWVESQACYRSELEEGVDLFR